MSRSDLRLNEEVETKIKYLTHLRRTSSARSFFAEAFVVNEADSLPLKNKGEMLGFKIEIMTRRVKAGEHSKKALLIVGSRTDLVDEVAKILESKWMKTFSADDHIVNLRDVPIRAKNIYTFLFNIIHAIFVSSFIIAVVVTLLAAYLAAHDKLSGVS